MNRRYIAKTHDGVIGPVPHQIALRAVAHGLHKCPTGRLNNAAFNLVDQTVRVDHQARIVGRPRMRDAHHPRAGVHLHIGHHGGVNGQVFVFRKTHTSAFKNPRKLGWRFIDTRFPFGHGGGALHHLAGARVHHVVEAEGQRVNASRGCQFIHKRFNGKHIGIGAQGS